MMEGNTPRSTRQKRRRDSVDGLYEKSSYGGDRIYSSPESRSRFEAYSRLQASAVAFGEKLAIPEIVAIGGQSDGKSTLLEALLGFRFNVKEVEMGTRRPLMLQMVHHPNALEPVCCLQDEDSDEYGPPIVPASSIAEAIRGRTEEHLKKLRGAAVSSKPIVLRAEYASCPNLTIIDTPGFVLKAKKGEPETTPDEILAMVKSLAAPQHRLLVFLQQSNVEWCSSLWLDSIRAIDPGLRRTVIVISKFDNRLKEFAERWEVDRYLSAAGYLGDNVRPFFVALPKDRGMASNEEFRNRIALVDAEVMSHLREKIKGGFDEDKFGHNIGFRNLKRFLESELQRRYREAAPATLSLLEQRCSEVADELARINAKLAATSEVAYLRRSAMMHAASIARHMVALIDGAADPDPAEWGRTTEEERADSGVGNWPGLTSDVYPPNATLKLYGGAAFERVLNEFRCATCSIDALLYPGREVANILLAHTGRGGGATAAASGIAREAARSWLGPLLDTACDRLAYVLHSLFDLAVERIRMPETLSNANNVMSKHTYGMSGYVAFHASLRCAHDRFVKDIARKCKDLVRHQLEAATSPFSLIHTFGTTMNWESMACNSNARKQQSLCMDITEGFGSRAEVLNEEAENMPLQGHQQTPPGRGGGKEREVLKESQMTVPETPSPDQQERRDCDDSFSKREEFGLVSGRLLPPDAAPQRKRHGSSLLEAASSRLGQPKETRLSASNGGTVRTTSAYTEVCSMAMAYFARIREVLVERSVPSTMNASLLTPCREELVVALGVELFAVRDEQFMEMFVAPGAVEQLEKEQSFLQKRSITLKACLQEFRTLSHSL